MISLIIARSTLKDISKNEFIYKQGDTGLYFYYLIRGSVTLLAKREEFGNF